MRLGRVREGGTRALSLTRSLRGAAQAHTHRGAHALFRQLRDLVHYGPNGSMLYMNKKTIMAIAPGERDVHRSYPVVVNADIDPVCFAVWSAPTVSQGAGASRAAHNGHRGAGGWARPGQ